MGFYGIIMVGLPIWVSLCEGKKKSIFFVGWPFCKGPSRRFVTVYNEMLVGEKQKNEG
jgi:hypothetical protein